MFTLLHFDRPIIIGTLVQTPAGPGTVVSPALNVELLTSREGVLRDCRTYPLTQVRLLPSQGVTEGADGKGHR